MDKRNNLIDLYRIALMIWIVLYHYTTIYGTLGFNKTVSFDVSFPNGGTVGVSLFFILSGFFFGKQMLSEENGVKYLSRIVAKRYVRLWSPYVIACILVFLWLLVMPLEGRSVSWEVFLINCLCFVHPGVEYVEGAHWFITDLFIFQALLSTLLLIKRPRIRVTIVSLLLITSNIYIMMAPNVLIGSAKRIFELSLGMEMYYLVSEKRWYYVAIVFCALIFLAIQSSLFLMWLLPFVIFGLIANIKMPPPIVKCSKFSDVSFSWYLVHQNIGYTIMFYFLPEGSINKLYILVPMAFTIFIAYPVHIIGTRIEEMLKICPAK